MLTRLLLVLILALTYIGCTVVEGGTMYEPVPLTPEDRETVEKLRREFLKIEDIKVGDGPIAVWGRKIEADIEVRYAVGDGKLIYRGPAYTYAGMRGAVMIHNSATKRGALSLEQNGIILGLNGMAVGGKRRITIHPKLVCRSYGTGEANPQVTCSLIEESAAVRKEQLIVEATLTASCTPSFILVPFIRGIEFCRDSEVPKRDPSDPIWRFYQAPPSNH